ncbi:hypothetical protein U5817_06805 [Aromatoleum evansii]|uniref:Uncharacterized protein n=1 Tax=Aromatoleum evansii TaxID=59406 RepID=A0ABZ1AQM1_AROEV|nr:hypothetical protein U5817_06805 [Aromatoleum evansii]
MSSTYSSAQTHWWSEFQAVSLEVGDWLWGTAQGAFNEKASLPQIIVDAVIGMIPVVGDVTAVRDLIAVTIGMVDDPAKREDKFEWALLVVLLFALIPVIGGVIKGVGRMVISVAKTSANLTGAARAAYMAETAKDITAFLNRTGTGNAEKWLLQLRFSDYQTAILQKSSGLIVTIYTGLDGFKTKFSGVLSPSMRTRLDGLTKGLKTLNELAAVRIPPAIRELDQSLLEIQAYIRSGGETTARTFEHTAASGTKTVTYADELRLIDAETGATRSRRGGWAQNPADPERVSHLYRHEAGYPDLMKSADPWGKLIGIPAFSGKILNRTMKEDEVLYRLFGPQGVTHGTEVRATIPDGRWWGLGAVPASAKEWRGPTGVLDEFNRDGFVVVGRVAEPDRIKACVGKVSEQSGARIPGQYLPGGALQAVIDLDSATKAALETAGEAVIATGKPQTVKSGGMIFELRPTGWSDANGVWGYLRMPGTATIQTARLGARELAAKDERAPIPATRTAKQ